MNNVIDFTALSTARPRPGQTAAQGLSKTVPALTDPKAAARRRRTCRVTTDVLANNGSAA